MLFLWALSGHQEAYLSSYFLLGLVTLMIGFSARNILSGATPWWSPHAFVLATMFLYFVVASVAVVHYRLPSMAFDRPLRPSELNAGLMVVVLATASYLLGFAFGPKPRLFPERIEWFFADTPNVQVRFNLVVMTVFLVGLAAWGFVFLSAGGVSGHLSNIANRQETLAKAGGIAFHLSKWAFVGFFLYFSRNGLRPTTLAMFAVLMMVYMAYGSRNWVGMFVAGTAIVYRIRFGKIPGIVLLAAIAGLAFVQSFLVLLRYTRGNIGMAQYAYTKNLRTTESTVLSFVGDFSFIRYLSDVAVTMGDIVPYQWGRTLLSFFFVIPSGLWDPTAYLVTSGGIYMQYLTADHIGSVSVGPSLLGEFIINFGWAGAVVFPLALGMILRWFQSAALSHPHRANQVAFPVMVAIVGPEMISFIKHGFLDTTLIPYLMLPLVIPYLPNLTYLTSGAPKRVAAPG
jgi:hypothetical protein